MPEDENYYFFRWLKKYLGDSDSCILLLLFPDKGRTSFIDFGL